MRKAIKSSVLVGSILVFALGAVAPPASAETNNYIRIRRFSFVQSLNFILPGDLISVENIDGQKLGIPHSLTSKIPGLFDTGVFTTGTRYINAPNTPGVYRYICVVHPGMTSQLTVQPTAALET
jgi:plastocyanin